MYVFELKLPHHILEPKLQKEIYWFTSPLAGTIAELTEPEWQGEYVHVGIERQYALTVKVETRNKKLIFWLSFRSNLFSY